MIIIWYCLVLLNSVPFLSVFVSIYDNNDLIGQTLQPVDQYYSRFYDHQRH